MSPRPRTAGAVLGLAGCAALATTTAHADPGAPPTLPLLASTPAPGPPRAALIVETDADATAASAAVVGGRRLGYYVRGDVMTVDGATAGALEGGDAWDYYVGHGLRVIGRAGVAWPLGDVGGSAPARRFALMPGDAILGVDRLLVRTGVAVVARPGPVALQFDVGADVSIGEWIDAHDDDTPGPLHAGWHASFAGGLCTRAGMALITLDSGGILVSAAASADVDTTVRAAVGWRAALGRRGLRVDLARTVAARGVPTATSLRVTIDAGW